MFKAQYKTFEAFLKNTKVKPTFIIRINHENLQILEDIEYYEFEPITIEVKNKILYIGFETNAQIILYAIPQEVRKPAETYLMDILEEEDEEELENNKIREEEEMVSSKDREEHEEEVF